MATQLNLEEQEQLDQLHAFWKKYGNLLTWVLILVLGSVAAWNGWNWWQRHQATQASAMYEELDKAVHAGDVDRASRVFSDLRERFPRTAFAEQAGLLAAQLQYDKGRQEAAQQSLGWVAEHAVEDEYRTVARLRLAGVLLGEKKYDAALAQLDAARSPSFAALVADRRGDVLLAQGKQEEAKAAYLKAWQGLDPGIEYRRLVEAKLTALGAAPAAPASAASGPAR